MLEFSFEELAGADLVPGAIYRSGEGNTLDYEPLTPLLGVGNVGGIRRLGPAAEPKFVVLYSSLEHPEWPDEIDPELGVLTYYGDNKEAGRDLLETGLGGNSVLKAAFAKLRGERAGIPPFFVFTRAGFKRDMRFEGLAVPGSATADPKDALEEVFTWGPGGRIANYKATFTILDLVGDSKPVNLMSWVADLKQGVQAKDSENCPPEFKEWLESGDYGRLPGSSSTRESTLRPTPGNADRGGGSAGGGPGTSRPSNPDEGGGSAGGGPGASSPSEDGFFDHLRRIQARGFGGDESAAAPGGQRYFDATPVPGAEEARKWFEDRVADPSGRPVHLFLLGGPGNGKSYLSSGIVSSYDRVDASTDSPQPRWVRYSTPSQDLFLVNDATDGSDAGNSLAVELEGAIEAKEHLLVNVNRGILLEEIPRAPVEGLARRLLQWLDGREIAEESGGVTFVQSDDSGFLRSLSVSRSGEPFFEAVAVSMDKTSLMEPRPKSELQDSEREVEVRCGDYRSLRFRAGRSVEESEAMIGAEVLRHVAAPGAVEGLGQAWNPIRANLESLSEPSFRAGFLSILRGSEIWHSSRLSYRNLWAIVGQAVMGFHVEHHSTEDLKRWLQERNPDLDLPPIRRLEVMLELASIRTHQAIYQAPAPARLSIGFDVTVASRALQSLQSMDPVRDFIPGKNAPSESDYGWANPVLEAFDAQDASRSPLESLRANLPEGDPACSAMTGFDEALDKVVHEAQFGPETPLNDIQKRSLASWYGQYLTR